MQNSAKGQLISEWNFGVFKSPKKPSKFLTDFCPSFIGQKSLKNLRLTDLYSSQILYYIRLFSKTDAAWPTYLQIWRHMWMLPKHHSRPDNFFARWINLLRILFVTSMPNATSFRIEALFIVWSKYFLSSVHLCFHELFYFFILTAIIALSNGKYCFSIYYFSKLYEMNITSENIWS